ncbi:Outer membrane protein beta-barrel domain-containing protein [Tenacibaculum sp. MAR_2009_124]|uniref:porin family protein n=1 Tax=Tenacibaculum sp. MAR_2009_124 TaxID=1250059 RepID=UPI00089A9CB6|nr:porin family protein [Tenacibaculum sp. MAR_2009_124]SEC31129.1 Outer membrane protein beta-barrel domain-containing protein [Tenacibaculum sp. MAR_2009_124]
MKKTVLAIVCMIAFATVNAQDVKFGVKAGLNVSTIRLDYMGQDDPDIGSRLGFHGGITLEAKLSDSFSIQPEVLYTQRGAKIEDATFKVDYISLPVMAKYYPIKGLSLEVGPEVSFLVNDKVVDNVLGEYNTKIDSYDFGINFGFGYQFDNGLFLQSRYSLGVVDIQDFREMKNGTFQMSLGYQF